MREIKFRARRIDNGEWVYFNLQGAYVDENGNEISPKRFIRDCGFKVVPETEGQYTGLKDSKGKEIFEGDVIQYDNERYEVYWSEEWAMFAVRGCQIQALIRYASYGEVIGNRYANPELLEA